MVLLVLGLALWFVAHGLKIHAPARRAELVSRMGEMPVKAAMALLLIGSVALMTKGYQAADFVNLWYPPAWTRHLNNLLMLVAVAVYLAAPFKGHVRHWIRHPQLAGVKIWALAHLLVNGDLASVVLFGGLLGWAVLAMIGINRRDGKGAKPAAGTVLGNLLHAGVTVAVFVAIAGVHNWFGVWPFPGAAPG